MITDEQAEIFAIHTAAHNTLVRTIPPQIIKVYKSPELKYNYIAMCSEFHYLPCSDLGA